MDKLTKEEVELVDRVFSDSDSNFRKRSDFMEEHFDFAGLASSMQFVKEEEADIWMECLSATNPSDLVHFDDDLLQKLFEMLEQIGINDVIGIPEDIFEEDTIPIPDVLITIEKVDGDVVRIVTGDGYGYFVYDVVGEPLRFVQRLCRYHDGESMKVVIDPFCGYADNEDYMRLFMTKFDMTKYYIFMDQILKLWYVLQILLLNPEVKNLVMKKDGKVKTRGACFTAAKDGRKARYVKRHLVHGDIFGEQKEDGTYERHTLCWYVIGHWREYQNGKKTFVKGYWKGPLRHSKKNLDKGRERLVC